MKLTPTDYPVLDVVRDRWSPRAFADRPVEIDTLRRVLEAARWAASSRNEQPWAFIVATREQADVHAKIANCLVEANRLWAAKAPVLMLTLARSTFSSHGQRNAHAWHDLGFAVGNLSAQATAEGVFLHQMGGILPDVARATFAIPADVDVVTGLALGYLGGPASLPDDLRAREAAPRTRQPQSAWVFGATYGEPF